MFVIDDEEDLCDVLSAFLQEHFQVEAFTSARSALAAIPEKHPEVILSDLSMPDMSGMTFVEEALSINPKLPILIMSGFNENHQDVKEVLTRGAKGLIKKPFADPIALVEQINKYK